ncbi:hypothetical protein MBLNU459_g4087t1 [Dothideomycetes sp. NU459]
MDILTFFYNQLFIKPAYPETSCEGKTYIVTGSNGGLGKEAVRHFVRLGAQKVILACRTVEKGEDAKKDIEKSEKSNGVVEVWQLDLSSYESVKQFAKRADGLKRIDGLIENAGIATSKFAVTEGNESTVTTNVISTFLLALLLMPALKRTAQQYNIQPNLVIVSSEVHALTTFEERKAASIFDTMNSPTEARMSERYQVSKLLEVLTVRELAAQHPQSYPVIINTLNPGLCHSELARDLGFGMIVFKFLLARTTEVGARTLVYAATAGAETHGQYLSNDTVTPPSKFVRSEEGAQAQKKVWKELSARLEAIQPGILNNL